MTRTVSLFVIVLSLASAAAAQQPSVELQIDTHKLEVGEAVDVQLVCTNTGPPSIPEGVVPDGLTLNLLNENPFTSSQVSIINGRRSEKSTYTYQMRLTATKEGSFELGSISVEADGRTYKTEPITIKVKNLDTAARPRGDSRVFAEIEVEPTSLYVSESYSATLTIGIRKVELGGRIYDLNLLELIDQRASQLSIFGGRYSSGDMVIADSTGQRHRYVVYRLRKQLRAEEVGDLSIGPVFLKVDYPTALRRGFFGSVEASRTRRETARADAVSIEVKGPPAQDRPEDFSGAIGRYGMEVTAKPLRVEQNQPVTLTIAIRGSAVGGIAGPDLSKQAELASRFDYVKEELVGELEGIAKVFRCAIFPKQQGEQTIPPISWSYFDSGSEQYVTLTSQPINITVDPPTAATTTIALLDNGQADPEVTTLTLLAEGISPNYVDPDLILADQSFAFNAPYVAAIALSPTAWAILALIARYRRRLIGDKGFARRRHARRRAETLVAKAVRKDMPVEQLGGLAEALAHFIADRFDLPPGELTPMELRDLLTDRKAADTLVDEVISFVEQCEMARFSPSAAADISVSETAGRVRRWIEQIERATR
ncbi:MAG: BatD family protein [Phycisphaerales bacterium]|nr:MAG: BatD family protein [Phycisphaerales bacterium]